jgi:NAD(P)-dependent dehydrogenase (short-subunit alcohol dehydrogenase family)
MRLAGKTALVTGGGSGIGQAIAERFAAEGAQVTVAGRTRASVAETVAHITGQGGAAVPAGADVTDAAAVQAMVADALDAMGAIDILVNNAGKAIGDGILETDVETWDLDLAVVLRSVFLCTKAVLPGMIDRRQGAIVNISSVNGLTGLGEEGYSAAKAGMINLTQNVAIRYGPSGIRANCICPATIRTPIWHDVLERDPDVLERLAAWYPLGRIGEPDDVANAALFLASDEASWVTGATLTVDGGLMAGSYRMARDLQGDGT